MKNIWKLPLLCALTLVGASQIFAQERPAPRLDNFDIKDGVRVASPVIRDVLPAKRIRLTANQPALAATSLAKPQARAAVLTQPRLAGGLGMAVSKSLDGYTTGDAAVDSFIVDSGTRHGVDPVLLYAIMHRESAFKKQAVSYKGARGLMQLMPATARRFGVTDIFNPRQNIDGGARYMRFLLDLFDGDVPLSLAGYNAGEGAVLKYGRRVPPYSETREYVRRISERYALMRDPQSARRALSVTPAQVADLKAAATTTTPSPTYERQVYSVRLPSGQLMLVSR
jgi:soluble lytic murein transglycosylase-like protein